MAFKCRSCGHNESERDDSLGHLVCTNCGTVAEENAIVAEVTFTEQSNGATTADGFRVRAGQARATNRSTFGAVHQNSRDSREQTLANGQRRIQHLGGAMKMSDRHIENAQGYFKLAVDYNFTKGRKGNNVVAACLYLVCRQENTSHFLIDFADYLNTNVYQLGATFLRLLQTLHIPQTEVPLVDPALYLARFAARLDFEDDTPAVIRDAERLVKRMQRDWIQVGRRPAGICAACLFIAGRMHGHRRAFRELAMVVKICETTLRRRLQEFKATASGQLSVQDFQTISLEHDADPPAFARSAAMTAMNPANPYVKRYLAQQRARLEREKHLDAAIPAMIAQFEQDPEEAARLTAALVPSSVPPAPGGATDAALPTQATQATQASTTYTPSQPPLPRPAADDGDGDGDGGGDVPPHPDETVVPYDPTQDESFIERAEDDLEQYAAYGLSAGAGSISDVAGTYGAYDETYDPEDEQQMQEMIAEIQQIADSEDMHAVLDEMRVELAADEAEMDLSYLDEDDEVAAALLTPDEAQFKEAIWSAEYQDWEASQALKRETGILKTPGGAAAAAAKKRKRESVKFEAESSPIASVQKMFQVAKPALSKKINYQVLNDLFDESDRVM